jgi:gliding motility-associated-like protein
MAENTNFNKGVIFILLFLFFNYEGQGQNNYRELRNIENKHMKNFQLDISNLKLQKKNEAVDFIYKYLGWSKSNSLRLQRVSIGINNDSLCRYQHCINEIPVLGSEVIIHYNHDLIYSVNGIVYNIDSEGFMGVIGVDAAREIAITHTQANSFKWEILAEDSLYKIWQNNPEASYYPRGKKVFCPKGLDFGSEFVLTYTFELNANEPLLRKNYFINANNGAVWAVEDLLHNTDVVGSANTKYRGVKPIITDSVASGSYRLREVGRGGGIETFNMQTGTNYGAAVDFTDADNYWNNYNSSYDEVATDAHFGAEMTYDYFLSRFNRNSFDGNGAKIRSYVHYRLNYVNAFWNGSVMTYGDGNGTTWSPLISLDVCGHEIAHAVTTNSAGLIYSYESGALNESFSDIFGNAIEYFADSLVFNWKIGEDIISGGSGLRNMSNPKLRGDPSTYKGQYWHTAASDNGGVHTNSGVQNFWFYLLSEGKIGTNDNGDTYTVDSLGIHKAEQIAFRNLTVYLTKSSQYNDARYYAIQSAADLYGDCSDEVIATTNAWHAVGVGDKYDSSLVAADFQADTLYCYVNEPVEFKNRSTNAKSYSWDFGDGTSSSSKDPIHQFLTSGYHSIELIVESCYYGVYDSLLKQNYVQFDSTRDICNGYLLPRNSYQSIHVCSGFIYDHNGEDDYNGLSKDTLTIDLAASDSAHLTFLEFDYESGFDSIYVYDGYNTSGVLLGGFTGSTLPNGGNPFKVNSGAITIIHFSDPFLEGTGFKAYFEAFRPPVALSTTSDTTVCYNQEIKLEAFGSGGDITEYSYRWNGQLGDSTLTLQLTKDTIIYILFGDDCMEEYILDSIIINVLDSLVLNPMSDITLCYLETVDLLAASGGGRVNDYVFTWLPSNVFGNSWSTQFKDDITIQLTVSDGCTPLNDTISFNVTVRDSLSHVSSSDTTICQGTTAILSIEAIGGLSTYYFDNSLSQTTGSSKYYNFDVSPVGTGRHDYWVNYTDLCTETNDTAFFVVNVMDSLSIQLGNDTTLCRGTTLDIFAVANGGNHTTYEYDWGYGFISDSFLNISGITKRTYYATFSDGCSEYSPMDSLVISLYDVLNATLAGPDSACVGETINMQATITGGNVISHSFDWDYGRGNTDTYSLPITTESVITFIASDGCTIINDTVFHLVSARAPLMITMPGDKSICLGQTTDIEVLVSGGLAIDRILTWDQGLGAGLSKTVTPISNTTYIVTLSDNCSESVTESIEIIVNPVPVVQFDASPNPSCTGIEIEFENKSTFSLPSTFLWDFGNVERGTLENEQRVFNTPGLYSIKLVVTNVFNCSDSLSKIEELEIQQHSIAKFTTNPEVSNYFNPNFDFLNQSSFADDYIWTFGDGSASSEYEPSYSYLDTGNYTVSLVVSNAIGCSDTAFKTVIVEDVFMLHIPNVFSPNNDNINDNYGIQSRGVVDYNMNVYTRWGEKVWSTQSQTETWNGEYNGKIIPTGIYIYHVLGTASDGSRFQRKGMISVIK